MKIRKKPLGTVNMVGANIEHIRKAQKIKQIEMIARMQSMGVDINPTSYSKLEGQIRLATDIEVFTIAKILQVDIADLFKGQK